MRWPVARWADRAAWFSIGAYIGYVIMAFATDHRIENVRHHVAKNSIEVGVQAGIAAYKKSQAYNESLLAKKRRERDVRLFKYVDNLHDFLKRGEAALND